MSAGARACPSCAYTNFGSHPACLHCGSELPPIDLTLPGSSAPARADRICPSCGTPASSSANFCRSCGANLV